MTMGNLKAALTALGPVQRRKKADRITSLFRPVSELLSGLLRAAARVYRGAKERVGVYVGA
jgi:hypothetical protein